MRRWLATSLGAAFVFAALPAFAQDEVDPARLPLNPFEDCVKGDWEVLEFDITRGKDVPAKQVHGWRIEKLDDDGTVTAECLRGEGTFKPGEQPTFEDFLGPELVRGTTFSDVTERGTRKVDVGKRTVDCRTVSCKLAGALVGELSIFFCPDIPGARVAGLHYEGSYHDAPVTIDAHLAGFGKVVWGTSPEELRLAIDAGNSPVQSPGIPARRPGADAGDRLPVDPLEGAAAGDWEVVRVTVVRGDAKQDEAFLWRILSVGDDGAVSARTVQDIFGFGDGGATTAHCARSGRATFKAAEMPRPVEFLGGPAELDGVTISDLAEGDGEKLTVDGRTFDCRKVTGKLGGKWTGTATFWFSADALGARLAGLHLEGGSPGNPIAIDGRVAGFGKVLFGETGAELRTELGVSDEPEAPAATAPVASATEAASPGQIDYGTMVKKGETFTCVSHMGGVDMTMRYTVKDVTASDVVYAMQVEMKNVPNVPPVPDIKLPRKVPGAAANARAAAVPKVGSETVTVSGIDIACDVYEMADPMNKGKKMRTWVPTNLPPMMVVKMVDGTGKTTMELTEIKGN